MPAFALSSLEIQILISGHKGKNEPILFGMPAKAFRQVCRNAI
jgi:hypothetical protein